MDGATVTAIAAVGGSALATCGGVYVALRNTRVQLDKNRHDETASEVQSRVEGRTAEMSGLWARVTKLETDGEKSRERELASVREIAKLEARLDIQERLLSTIAVRLEVAHKSGDADALREAVAVLLSELRIYLPAYLSENRRADDAVVIGDKDRRLGDKPIELKKGE